MNDYAEAQRLELRRLIGAYKNTALYAESVHTSSAERAAYVLRTRKAREALREFIDGLKIVDPDA